MIMASKRPGKKKDDAASPIDEKRKALLEHERKIAEQIARRERLIKDAPMIAQEEARRRREELMKRKSRVETAQINGNTVYRVRMGPYASAGTLAAAKQALTSHGIDGAQAIRVK